VGTVFFHALSSPGTAVVRVTARGAIAEYAVSITAEGPLAPPTFISAAANAEGGMLFQWSLPPTGIPTAASIALLGRGADGQWLTIATFSASTTSFNATAVQISGSREFGLKVHSAAGGSSSALSNVLGGSSGLPTYALIDLGPGTPKAVASDGTVVLTRPTTSLTYRNRGGVDESLGETFDFLDMNDGGDIAGYEYATGDTASVVFANHAVSNHTPWSEEGYGGGTTSFGTRLTNISENKAVAGQEYRSEVVDGRFHTSLTKDFISTVPLNLPTVASSTRTFDIYEQYPSSGSGTIYQFKDLNNHRGAVGKKWSVGPVSGPELPLYYGSAPTPSGDSSFEPFALNDDGLVLGRSSGVIKLWDSLAGAFRTLSLPNVVGDYDPLRVTDPPASDPNGTTFILAGNNVVIRTWKDSDGVSSPFPIHTTFGADELLPVGSPYSNLSFKNIANNGVIVATASKTGDSFTHAILLLPFEFKARDGRINYGFDPPMKGLPNANPPVPDDSFSEPAWASVVSDSTSNNVKLVLPASFAPKMKLSIVLGDQYINLNPKDTALSGAETTITLSGLAPTLIEPVTAEIEARLVSNSDNVSTLEVLVLPERTVPIGIYRVTDPGSPATSPVEGPTDSEVINTLNDIYKQAGVKFSVQASGNRSVSYDSNSDGRVQHDEEASELGSIATALASEPGAVKVILVRESGIPYPTDPSTHVRAVSANNFSFLFVKTIVDNGGDIAFIEAHEMGHVLDLPAANRDSSEHDVGPAPTGTGRLMGSGSRDPISGILPASPAGRWLPHEDWLRANVEAAGYQ
jgi:hypothetical protein